MTSRDSFSSDPLSPPRSPRHAARRSALRHRLACACLGAAALLGVALPVYGQPAEDDLPPIRPLRTQGLPVELAALILSGQQGGVVPYEMLPLVTPAGADEADVIVVFDISPRAFQLGAAQAVEDRLDQVDADTPDGESAVPTVVCGGTQKVEIVLYAVTEGGGVRGSMLQTFEIDTDRVQPCLLESGTRFVGRLRLPQGDVSLRSLVRVAGEHVGLRVTPLSVGPTSAEGWLSPPLVFGLQDDRPTLYEVKGGGAPVTRPPAGLGGVPAADPVVQRDQTVSVKVLASGVERIGSQWFAVLSDGGGKVLAHAPAKLTYGPAEDDVRVLELSFDTAGFPIGRAVLNLQASATAGVAPKAPEAPAMDRELQPEWRDRGQEFSMLSDGTEGEGGGSTPQLVTPPVRLHVVADAAAAFSSDLVGDLPEGFDPKSAQAQRAAAQAATNALPAIRDALDTGAWSAARDGILQLANAVSDAYGQEGLNQVGRVTLETFAAEGRDGRLLPASLLHYDVYRESRRLRQYLVSTYSREVFVALARRLEDTGRQNSSLAADLYALVGAELQSAGLVRFSTAMFRRAVDLDPNQLAARLSLAINLEQLGLGEEAVAAYDQLLDIDPNHDVAALRRAVILRRLGRGKAARSALERLVESSSEAWVLSVAYQELALERLAQDGPPAARDLLREGLRRLPREPRLYVLLSFVFDTLGQKEAAQATLEEMKLKTPTGSSGGYTPRHRLTQWSTDAAAGLEGRLRTKASRQLSALQGGAR